MHTNETPVETALRRVLADIEAELIRRRDDAQEQANVILARYGETLPARTAAIRAEVEQYVAGLDYGLRLIVSQRRILGVLE